MTDQTTPEVSWGDIPKDPANRMYPQSVHGNRALRRAGIRNGDFPPGGYERDPHPTPIMRQVRGLV